MATKIRDLLIYSPKLYHLLKSLCFFFSIKHFKYCIQGTEATALEWSTRHLQGGNDWGESSRKDWVKSYWDSKSHPHRSLLVEKILKYSPKSVLELGCNCGPNLFLLSKRLPYIELSGIDINPVAIKKGNEWLTKEGISNINLSEGKADDLKKYSDKYFDVVFTDAVLIYIGPDKIIEIIKESIRITKKAIILVEWHDFKHDKKDPYGLGIFYNNHWKRDYASLLKPFIPENQIYITKITKELWPDETWYDVGAIIEIVLEVKG